MSTGEGCVQDRCMGSGLWEPLNKGDARAAPVDFPSFVQGHPGSAIHKTAKASSLGVHGWQAEVGTTGKESEKHSFIPGLKLIKGRVQHTKSFSDCKDKKIK